jgi:hypothetical protein
VELDVQGGEVAICGDEGGGEGKGIDMEAIG